MIRSRPPLGRRGLLLAIAALAARPAWAALAPTTAQGRGPFYPEEKPLDHDNDLTRVAGRTGRAQGATFELSGRVLRPDGRAIAGAEVEIWQANAFGRYHHPRDRSGARLDPDFQGVGISRTEADGWYRFRTIVPAPYGRRTRHIHFRVAAEGTRPLITQLYFAGEPLNANDPLLGTIADAAERARLMVAIDPISGAGRFDLVLP